MKKLRDLSDSGFHKLIMLSSKISGVSNEPTDKDISILIPILREQFGSLDYDFFASAFKNNAVGAYGEIIKPFYDNFSLAYIGQVIQAAKEHRRKSNIIPKPDESKALPEPESDPKRSFDFIKKVWDEEGKLPIIGNWKSAFEYAENEGIISLSDEEKNDIKSQVESEVKSSIANARSKMEDYRKLEIDLRPMNVKIACRKRALKDYFENKT